MRISLFLIFQSLFLWNTLSQSKVDSILKVLPEFQTKGYSIPVKYLGERKGKPVMVFAKGRYGHSTKFIIEFDSMMNPLNEYELFEKDENPYLYISNNERNIIITKDASKRKHSYSLIEVDLDELKFDRIGEVASFEYSGQNIERHFSSFNVGYDSSFFYLIHEGRKKNELIVKTLDLNFDSITQFKYEIPQGYVKSSIVLIKKDELILLSERVSAVMSSPLVNDKYLTKQYLISLKKGETRVLPLGLEKKYNTSSVTFLEKTNNLYLFSFYSDSVSIGVNGIHYSAISLQDFQPTLTKSIPFTDSILELHTDKERIKNKIMQSKSLEHYTGSDLFYHEDGSFSFVGEQRYLGYGGYGSTLYFSKNLMVSSISKEGELNWMQEVKNEAHADRVWLYDGFLTIPFANKKYALNEIIGKEANILKNKYSLMIHSIDGTKSEPIVIQLGDFRFSTHFAVYLGEQKFLLYFQHLKKFERQRFAILDVSKL